MAAGIDTVLQAIARQQQTGTRFIVALVGPAADITILALNQIHQEVPTCQR